MSVVDPAAQLADDVEVGPFCVVGPHVRIGARTRLLSHVSVLNHTTLGTDNEVHPGTVLGGKPQDLKWKGEPTQVDIGDHNVIREHVTINLGTIQDKFSGGVTRVGSHNLLMANVHLGHDCQVGDHCILANNCMLAGHVQIKDRVTLLGGVGIHHFVIVGAFAYVTGAARLQHDIPPFVKVQIDGRFVALNKVGLRRAGYDNTAITELEGAIRALVKRRGKPLAERIRDLHLNGECHSDVRELVSFIERRSSVKNGRWMESLRYSSATPAGLGTGAGAAAQMAQPTR
jgi:UDP-N-acetylglucosamine acyltransferase